MDFRELDLRVADLEVENKRLRAALKAIANPAEHMAEEAKRQGIPLEDWMVDSMSDSTGYLKGLAEAALKGQ